LNPQGRWFIEIQGWTRNERRPESVSKVAVAGIPTGDDLPIDP
jgi:predicted metal-binding protein